MDWPQESPTHGLVVLRGLTGADIAMVQDLSTDPYWPLVSSLPGNATQQQALDWIQRQRGRLAEGIGYSFAIADAATGEALGQIGLWLANLEQGRATAGYGIAPRARGRGGAADALQALTTFAWTIPAVHRIELYIEPTNTSSIRTAERVGYLREGLLRSHQQIGSTRRDMLLYAVVRPS